MVPVLVTTAHRGVFFGFADEASVGSKASIMLHRCRCCIHWSADTGGFLGLAAKGPTPGCRIGTEAPEVLLHDITSVSRVTEEAAERWTAA